MTTLLQALNAANRLGNRHREKEEIARRLFKARYGKDFSDVDCDPIIDLVSGATETVPDIKTLDEIVLSYSNLKPVSSGIDP